MQKVLPRPIPKDTTDRMFRAWKQPIDRGENLLVISPPVMDRSYRIPEYIRWLGKGYDVRVVSLVGDAIEDADDWESAVGEFPKTKKQSVIVVNDAEFLWSGRENLLPGMAAWHLNERTPILFFTEIHPEGNLPPVCIQNRYFQMLYAPDDVAQFLNYLEVKFSVRLSVAARSRITERCGGHLWLVKEVVRFIASKESGDPFDHEGLQYRVEQIWKGFSENYQNALREAAIGRQPENREHTEYFIKTGIVRDNRIAIGLLDEYVKRMISQEVAVRMDANRLYIRNVCIDAFLSHQEHRLIKLLVSQPDVTISRETIGKAIWGDDGDFSDWALDQALRRLRQKLLKFGIPLSWIRTVKGKGYYVKG
jgi:DNA-binding response OmpR family regulator